ncbi:four-carbon acid sugar kinase family protein [Nonomuraea sp. KC401]|uniref:3-oxo-tetronate kinase n=1 Tax=unclassified Nonomuraea TaxID=2593643 RepID=UPI0010FF568F|nr:MULTISPECIES: 3-oxo-tetronate kinase [unclassified Nonomuraea]NBF00030.1 four-carbon acid sugar kinase family protein [Nonomuraea sp. K271]TLF54396.1 four-carbon acid sugar kinase family protein [Nonomuraea sp. KC401]
MIGAIADDFTGATDVAVALRRRGIRTVLFFGLPPESAGPPEHDAVVIALKTRTAPRADAVAQSTAALGRLRSRGVRQVYVKYCSTFDSTAEGNIGPVLDALAEAMDVPVVAMTPSSPEHGRTQYNGYLFVGDVLLGESHMRHHPLTPMTDSFLPRLLERQSAHRAGVVTLAQVRAGAIGRRLAELRAEGVRYALVDAVDDADLVTAGRALVDAPLVAGAAGLAGGLAAAHARTGREDAPAPAPQGAAAVLAGSCSARTLEQVSAMIEAGRPAYRLDVLADQDPESLARDALAWYDTLDAAAGAPLVHASAEPAALRRVQEALGVERSAAIVESAIGRVAQGLVERGVTRVISAGGETSGAVVNALGVLGGVIGAEAARGVPWIHTSSGLALLLKSGNFGEPGLLVKASR